MKGRVSEEWKRKLLLAGVILVRGTGTHLPNPRHHTHKQKKRKHKFCFLVNGEGGVSGAHFATSDSVCLHVMPTTILVLDIFVGIIYIC